MAPPPVAKIRSLEIVAFGESTWDVDVLGADRARMFPGGPAYRLAIGLEASGARASVFCSVPRRFGALELRPFQRGAVSLVFRNLAQDAEPLRTFHDGARTTRNSGEGGGEAMHALVRDLEDLPVSGFALHFSSLPGRHVARLSEDIRQSKSPKLVSWSMPWSEENLSIDVEFIRSVDVIFCTTGMYRLATEVLSREILQDKIFIVFEDSWGACVISGCSLVYRYSIDYQKRIATERDFELFVGAFLGLFAKAGDPTAAVAFACEFAAQAAVLCNPAEALSIGRRLAEPARVREFVQSGRTTVLKQVDGIIESIEPDASVVKIEATGLFAFREGDLLLATKTDDSAIEVGLYYVPGGKLEPNETAEACAIREFMEETALGVDELTPISIFYYHDEVRGRLYRFHQFLLSPSLGQPVPNDDVSALIWLPFVEVRAENVFAMTWAQIVLLRPFI